MKKVILPFHVVLLGQVASGKDTQAALLKGMYAFKPIESGKYWRKMQKAKTPEGELLRKTTSKGLPAPVSLMKKFLEENLTSIPKNKTLLFVGNPRLKPEAQLLHKLMVGKKERYVVFYINLSDREVLKRSHLRDRSLEDRLYVEKRIAWHKDQVGKTVLYFKKTGPYAEINGNQSVEKVHLDIQKKIYHFLLSH
jgi:adenylate kinase family enzyme